MFRRVVIDDSKYAVSATVQDKSKRTGRESAFDALGCKSHARFLIFNKENCASAFVVRINTSAFLSCYITRHWIVSS
jgi:hypothetical protein